jgi:hypothetical protein
MNTGVIIYVVGRDDDLDMEEAVKKLNIRANRVEVNSSESGHFDIMDAWWSLTVKGMKRIVCMLAEVTDHSELKLTGSELRLCG